MYVFILIVSAVLAACGQLCLKKAAGDAHLPDNNLFIYTKNLMFNLFAWLGAFSYGTSFLVYMVALKKIQLSTARSFSALSYVLVITLSIFIFNDQVNIVSIIGMVLITSGIVLVGISYY